MRTPFDSLISTFDSMKFHPIAWQKQCSPNILFEWDTLDFHQCVNGSATAYGLKWDSLMKKKHFHFLS
jgi:hypothetical protein